MTATVEIRLIGADLAGAMRQMRIWLDHRKIAPHTLRQSTLPGGLSLRIEFDVRSEAEEFAAQFAGRVLGAPPVYATGRITGLSRG